MGLPATDISTPVKPGQEPRTAVDTGEPAAVRVPQGNKEVDLIRQSRLRSPENVERQRQIDEGILTWTDKGWAPGTTVDSKINARQYMQEQGANPVEANRIAAEAGGKPEANEAFDASYPQKLAASEGPEIDDETLRQLVQERFGIDLPQQQDPAKILRLAEMYAHGSARKPMKRFEAPDEAQLPDLVKPTMQKARIDEKLSLKGKQARRSENYAPALNHKYSPLSFPKGVHLASQSLGSVPPKHAFGRQVQEEDLGNSDMGHAAIRFGKPSLFQRILGAQDSSHVARNIAKEKIAEQRAMPKPNLPKSEFIKK